MKGYSRKKESVKSGLCILLGIVGVYFISEYLQTIYIDDEIPVISEIEEVGQEIVTSEIDNTLNIEAIYEWSTKILDEGNLGQLITQYLPGGAYLKSAHLQQEKEPYQIKLTYYSEQYDKVLSKARKDQIALVDASILMSLYPDIDTIQIETMVEEKIYHKTLYRPDLEEYFGIRLEAQEGKKTFERIAKEFMSADAVSSYWGEKHLYDSPLGEEVEAFFKMNFPVVDEMNQVFPYIDEDLEQELVEEYGYSLFLQGLAYENPLMNYYSACRLIEYYGQQSTEEIMLELATCATKSEDLRVQQVCQRGVDLLKPLQEDETKVFGRFEETVLGGGRKIYKIDQEGISVLAKWKGQAQAGLKVLSLSPNNQYVLCKAQTNLQSYYYVVPLKKDYELSEEGVYKEQKKYQLELVDKLEEALGEEEIEQAIAEEDITFVWELDSLLNIQVGEHILVYDVQKAYLQTREAFEQEFDLDDLKRYFEGNFEVNIETDQRVRGKDKAQVLSINQEILKIYSYANVTQKNIALVSEQEDIKQKVGKRWSKGKLIVDYSGQSEEIIQVLNQAMQVVY
ncbi:MAG: hypothetical protein E7231_15590 [Cellulosilyticum sp.]|nr:hypothetical protein [Cellulosilyticum sp.]